MQYEQVWNAVDKLAKVQGLSASGLAKKAGLDATTFNKSKRIRPDGKKRWPSLDSINKIIEVSGISFEQFYNMIENETMPKFAPSIPFIKASNISEKLEIHDKGFNTNNWSKVRFPDSKDNLLALDIDSDNYLPNYRSGTLLILSKNSEVRRGDRVAIFKNDGSLLIKEFIRRTSSSLEVVEIDDLQKESSIDINQVKLVNRIVWAGQ